VPCKTKERMEELQQALFFDCGGPVRKVNYIDVFQDDHEGNQGKFVEAMRDQYLEESIEYSDEIIDALENMNGSSSSVVKSDGLNLNQLREAFLGVDPLKPLGEVDELIARGCGIDVDEIEELDDSFTVDTKIFIKKLKTGILRRTGRKDD
jgi:disulfide oxidoreductase YuzD